MSQLSNLINDALDRRGISGESTRELSARTDGAISKDSILRYREGRHGAPSEPVLVALAGLTGLPIEDLRQAAGLTTDGGGEWIPPADSVRLNRRQRAALDELIKAMVAPAEDREDPEWFLAHPDRDPVLQAQLADVRAIKSVPARQRDALEVTVREERRASLIRDLSHNSDRPRETRTA